MKKKEISEFAKELLMLLLNIRRLRQIMSSQTSLAQVQGTLHIVIYRPNQIATPVHKVGPPNQPSNNVNGGLTTIPQNQITEPFTREIL